MKVLVIGQGGREHVLAWKLSKSKGVSQVFCAPGNAGMASIGKCVPIKVDAIDELIQFAKNEQISLTVVGPEAPLVEGIVDAFKKEGLRIFGPDKYASQLEGSKKFSKELMNKLNVPTAEYSEFTDSEKAKNYLKEASFPIVIKADGLAAGKGVVIATELNEALNAIDDMMCSKVFGEAGNTVVIEEFLEGEETSLIALSDGEDVVCLASSQDHKRIGDGDTGLNTGGMGAYSPAPIATQGLLNDANQKVFVPVIQELKRLGHPYIGFLYAGIMVTATGIKVLEFNVRFGDPEAQVVLLRLEADLFNLLNACCDQKLKTASIEWNQGSAVTVVLASKGYPVSSGKGQVIRGIDKASELDCVEVFHAGTKEEDSLILTNGGRVLNVTALGDDIQSAVNKVYQAVECIDFEGMQYRKDIAYRALKRAEANL